MAEDFVATAENSAALRMGGSDDAVAVVVRSLTSGAWRDDQWSHPNASMD